MAKSYSLKLPPEPDVTLEVHGEATLVVSTQKAHPNLTRAGAGRGHVASRGWTPAAKKAMRVRVEDHKHEFKTHLSLKFPAGSGRDTASLHDIQDKVSRWLREHFGCHYIRKVEFADYTTNLHWHFALDVTLTPEQVAELAAYCERHGLSVAATTPGPDELARYLGKSEQTSNPPWFAAAAFKPWGCTFPKPEVETRTVSFAAAKDAGVLHYGLTYGGKGKLEASQTVTATGGAENQPTLVSLTGDIPPSPPLSLTGDIAHVWHPEPTEHWEASDWHHPEQCRERCIAECGACWAKPGDGSSCAHCGERWVPRLVN